MKRLGIVILVTGFSILVLAASAGGRAKKAASPEMAYVCPKRMIAYDKPG